MADFLGSMFIAGIVTLLVVVACVVLLLVFKALYWVLVWLLGLAYIDVVYVVAGVAYIPVFIWLHFLLGDD